MSANLLRARPLGTLALTLACAALAAAGGAGTAAASAEGCTYTTFPYEYVCTYVHGKGLHVDTVDVIRGKMAGGTIRDYSASVTVDEPDGGHDEFWTTAYPDKVYGRAVVTLHIDQSFEDGSKICGSFYEGGQLQDTTCLGIHS
jgi:hypothetical protein